MNSEKSEKFCQADEKDLYRAVVVLYVIYNNVSRSIFGSIRQVTPLLPATDLTPWAIARLNKLLRIYEC